jgi:glycosyltransferase involved in cell wall biosynthesis
VKVLIVHYTADAPGKAGGAESAIRDQRRALELCGHEVETAFQHPDRAWVRFKPDVTHFHTVHVGMGIGILQWAQAKKIPHCLSLHDYWPFCGDRMLMQAGALPGNPDTPCSAVEGLCDGQCANGRATAELMAVVNGSPTVTFNHTSADILRRNGIRVDAVIPHAIDTDLFTPAPSERTPGKIVCVSAWPTYNTKGVHGLKDALARIGAHATLISGLPREQVRAELCKAAILVFPSTYQETWGLCLTEGLSTGLACISSNVAGPREQITDGVNGRLFANRDALALAAILSELLADDSECQRLGANARAWAVEHASLERMGRDYGRFYEELTHGRIRESQS